MKLRVPPILFCFFVMGFVDALGPLATTIQKQYQLSGFMAALLPAFAFVAFAAFSVPGGLLATRIGKRNLLLVALALNAAGVLVPTVAVPGYALLLAAVFVLGVGTTLLQVAGNPIMRDVSAEGRFASNLSFAQFVKGAGSVASTALVTRLALGETGWRRVFPVFLALTLACLLTVLLLKVKETRIAEPPSMRSSLSLLGRPDFGLAVLGIFLYVGAEVGLSTWLKPHLKGVGFEDGPSGFMGPTLFFAGLTAGRLLGGAMLRVLSPRSLFRISSGLGIIGLLMLLAGIPQLAIAGVVCCGLGFANIWPVLFSLTVEKAPERSAELSGLMCMAIFGGAILPPVMGWLVDTAGLRIAFIVPLLSFGYLMVLSLTRDGGRQDA
ncbi:MAG: MFS transporter [Vicinamibacteria bacterium]|nr:MFS transporter [Vicinamibacteria bacterium]